MTMASNTFVHKHYEKVILAALLLLFSGLLYLQLSVVQKSQGKKVDDIVNAKEPPADFVKTDYNAKEFSREALFDKNNLSWHGLWEGKNPFTNDKNAAQVDMMIPVKMALCKNANDIHLTPISSFPPIGSEEKGKCIFCHVTLDAPKKADADVVDQSKPVSDNDINRNGIPDTWEELHKIFVEANGDEPAPIGDNDKDGFDDKEEYLAGTHPCDPKSHPAYVTKLVLNSEKTVADVAFEEFLDSKLRSEISNIRFEDKIGADRGKFRYTSNGKTRRMETCKVGTEILYRKRATSDPKGFVPSIGFKLDKIDMEEMSVQAKNGNVKKVKVPVAEIVSVTDPALRFKCYKNQPIITGHLRVFLLNTVDQKNYNVRIGEKITLGSEEFGEEEYTASAILGTGAETVLILKDGKGAEFKVALPAPAEGDKAGDTAS